MHYNEQLREVMGRILGGRSTRAVAAEIGCDPTPLWAMQRYGRVPRRETITRIANGLRLAGELREELFAAAGYIEFPAVEEDEPVEAVA